MIIGRKKEQEVPQKLPTRMVLAPSECGRRKWEV
jgi:hypothetical protein